MAEAAGEDPWQRQVRAVESSEIAIAATGAHGEPGHQAIPVGPGRSKPIHRDKHLRSGCIAPRPPSWSYSTMAWCNSPPAHGEADA